MAGPGALWEARRSAEAVRRCARGRCPPLPTLQAVVEPGKCAGFVSEDQVHARPRKPLRPELSEICFGKRVGKRRDWLFEQVKDSRVGGVPERLRQSFKLVPGSVREAK